MFVVVFWVMQVCVEVFDIVVWIVDDVCECGEDVLCEQVEWFDGVMGYDVCVFENYIVEVFVEFVFDVCQVFEEVICCVCFVLVVQVFVLQMMWIGEGVVIMQ